MNKTGKYVRSSILRNILISVKTYLYLLQEEIKEKGGVKMKKSLIKVCAVSAVLVSFCSVVNASRDIDVKKNSDNIILVIEGMESIKSKKVQININLDDLKKSSLKEISDDSRTTAFMHSDERKDENRFGDIVATIRGLRSKKGKIKICLNRQKNSFSREIEIVDEKYSKIKGESVDVCFKDIPVGEYSLSIFHDENMNKMLDKDPYDIPEEGYAFSKNFTDIFETPDFENIKFIVEENKTYKGRIYLIYKN